MDTGITAFDSPSEYYKKTASDSGYIIVQLGFTAFRYEDNEDQGKYNYRSYNFYIIPQSKKQRFKCQGESMSFLARNNFDFNKLYQSGISYCNLVEEKKLREKFEEKKSNYSEDNNELGTVPVPEEEKEALDNINKIVTEFLKSNEVEKVIGNVNAFQRRLIYQNLEEKFGKNIFVSSRLLPNSTQKVRKFLFVIIQIEYC